MRGINDDEMGDFVELTRHKAINVRFIEYMPFDGNVWAEPKMVTYRQMLDAVQQRFPNGLQRMQVSPLLAIAFLSLAVMFCKDCMWSVGLVTCLHTGHRLLCCSSHISMEMQLSHDKDGLAVADAVLPLLASSSVEMKHLGQRLQLIE